MEPTLEAGSPEEPDRCPVDAAGCPIREAQQEKGNPIGAMNGKWAFLLKLVLITTPAAWAIFVTVDLPWRVWVTKATFAQGTHAEAAARLTEKLEKYIDARERDYRILENRIDDLPPEPWRERILQLEDWERENRVDHADIKVSLEGMRMALEAIKEKLNIPPTAKPGTGQLPYNNPQENRDAATATARRGGDSPGLGSSDS